MTEKHENPIVMSRKPKWRIHTGSEVLQFSPNEPIEIENPVEYFKQDAYKNAALTNALKFAIDFICAPASILLTRKKPPNNKSIPNSNSAPNSLIQITIFHTKTKRVIKTCITQVMDYYNTIRSLLENAKTNDLAINEFHVCRKTRHITIHVTQEIPKIEDKDLRFIRFIESNQSSKHIQQSTIKYKSSENIEHRIQPLYEENKPLFYRIQKNIKKDALIEHYEELLLPDDERVHLVCTNPQGHQIFIDIQSENKAQALDDLIQEYDFHNITSATLDIVQQPLGCALFIECSFGSMGSKYTKLAHKDGVLSDKIELDLQPPITDKNNTEELQEHCDYIAKNIINTININKGISEYDIPFLPITINVSRKSKNIRTRTPYFIQLYTPFEHYQRAIRALLDIYTPINKKPNEELNPHTPNDNNLSMYINDLILALPEDEYARTQIDDGDFIVKTFTFDGEELTELYV